MLESLDPVLVLRSIAQTGSISNTCLNESLNSQEGLEIASEMSRRPITIEEFQREGYTEYQPVYSDEDKFFSFGGPPELSFGPPGTTDNIPLCGTASNETVIRDRLWWWRQIPNWAEVAEKVFLDNFETSSFNYELAARCIYGRKWKPFGMPWLSLSNFQRGMLNAMWPTKRYGRHTFIRGRHLSQFQVGRNTVLVPVDLRVPQADVLSMVAEIHRRERLKRNLPEPGGRRKKEESSTWEIIELLDRKHLLGQQLTASEERLIEAVIQRLFDDCKRLGINVEV